MNKEELANWRFKVKEFIIQDFYYDTIESFSNVAKSTIELIKSATSVNNLIFISIFIIILLIYWYSNINEIWFVFIFFIFYLILVKYKRYKSNIWQHKKKQRKGIDFRDKLHKWRLEHPNWKQKKKDELSIKSSNNH